MTAPALDPHPGRHGGGPLGLLDELEPAPDRSAGVVEVEHDAVAEPFDRSSTVRPGRVLDDTCQV